MRKYILFILLFTILLSAKAQNDTFPTIGEVFNFEVGDTFQYRSDVLVGSSPLSLSYYYTIEQQVIVERSLSQDTARYKALKTEVIYHPGAPYPYSTQISAPSFVYFVYTNLSDTIENYAHNMGWNSIGDTNCLHIDTMDMVFNGVIGFIHNINCGGGVEEISFSKGIGLVSYTHVFEDPYVEHTNTRLTFFHKTTGETGGGLYNIPNGVEDLDEDFAITVFPNPTEDHFQISTEYPITFTLHNSLGQQVLSQKVDRFATISCNGILPGIYYWVAETDEVKAGLGKLIFK